MNGRNPTLQMLPAFEATARLLSFKKAADELCVTPSAISQQIKQLESVIDAQLFIRSTRHVSLTEIGKLFFQVASSTLNHYESELHRFSQSVSRPVLRLSTLPYIAYDILIPALSEFSLAHEQVDLRVEASESIVDFDDGNYSAAIRIGDGKWPGLHSRLLKPLSATIVGAPSLLDENKIYCAEDLKEFTLIHARSHMDDWQDVANIMDLDLSDNKQIFLDSYFSAASAAEQGLGLVIGLLPISNRRIAQQRLVRFFDFDFPVADKGFYFVQQKGNEENEAIEFVYHWVKKLFELL